MTMFNRIKGEISISFQIYMELIITAIFEMAYTIVVIFINWVVDKVIGWASPTGFSYWSFLVLQILFAGCSLLVLLIHIWGDLKIAYLRARKRMLSIEKLRDAD